MSYGVKVIKYALLKFCFLWIQLFSCRSGGLVEKAKGTPIGRHGEISVTLLIRKEKVQVNKIYLQTLSDRVKLSWMSALC